jgi:superfamily II DNA or RNA helicase
MMAVRRGDTSKERRRFNSSERVAAYLIAGGKCEDCGAELEPGWHGDHDTPYSLGGATDAMNIRALCPKCNLKKGNKRMGEKLQGWPASIALRAWQDDAFNAFIRHERPNFLLVATPGGGKTILALRCAHLLLSSGKIDRVVIVVPTCHLRKQWVKAAHRCGIDLNGTFENADGRESRDYHGVVLTYHAIAAQPDLHRKLSRSDRTLVVLDEVHHAGGTLTWGDAVQHAFEPAIFRLCMSGTPFRQDNNPIPFVEYDGNKSHADYSYNYAMALKENVCRSVIFPKFEGEISWLSDDEMQTHSFKDQLGDEEAAKRLRAALLAPTWMEDVITEANGELLRIREDDPRAGGLVIAMDQLHARQVADIVERVTGRKPVVAISDEDDASLQIAEFEQGSAPWIVAVKMVSEGVDIPRLRVCVYATNVTSELFFRQAIGRIVRRRGDDDMDAFFFIPADDRLISHARVVKHERDHVIRERVERAEREFVDGEGAGDAARLHSPFLAYDASAEADGAIHDGFEYEQELIRRYGKAASDNGISPVRFLAALRDAGLMPDGGDAPAQEPAPETPKASKDERKSRLRDAVNSLANTVAGALSRKTGQTFQESIKYVHRNTGQQPPRQADEQNLIKRLELLRELERKVANGSI